MQTYLLILQRAVLLYFFGFIYIDTVHRPERANTLNTKKYTQTKTLKNNANKKTAR